MKFLRAFAGAVPIVSDALVPLNEVVQYNGAYFSEAWESS